MKWPSLTSLLGRSRIPSTRTRKADDPPLFSELSLADVARLDQQRAVVENAAKQRYGAGLLTRGETDLAILQRLLDDGVFEKSQTYELQCLGVAFGDVLASQFSLRWVIINDEFGCDPTLRFENTTVNINALTMISKRVERDQPVNVFNLLQQTQDALSQAQKEFS